jgi:mRNA interferase YafQ
LRTQRTDNARQESSGSTAQFRKDVKLAQRRGKNMEKLREVILLLLQGEPLPPQYKDHPLA